jgi:hypothetical protein
VHAQQRRPPSDVEIGHIVSIHGKGLHGSSGGEAGAGPLNGAAIAPDHRNLFMPSSSGGIRVDSNNLQA